MTVPSPLDDVRAQYEALPYPPRDPRDEAIRLVTGTPSHILEVNHYLFSGRLNFNRPFRALVAGGGTGDACIMLAQQLADRRCPAEVVYLDLSSASRQVCEARAKARGLRNVQFLTGSLLDLPNMNIGQFDYIDCTGVLHHLPDPDIGLRALRDVLAPDGAMQVMVYARYGRAGIYMMQEYCRLLGVGATEAELRDLGATVEGLSSDHPIAGVSRKARDFTYPAALADALLHPQDRAYTVPDLYAWLERCGLSFGRWVEQAPYLPQCGAVARLPHAARLAALAPPLQHAAVELLRGTMTKHNFIAYRDDRSGESQPITFDGDAWLRSVPLRLPWTLCVRDRVHPGFVAVLINRAHSYPDLALPIDAAQQRVFLTIDGKRPIDEILRRGAGAIGDEQARRFIEQLWQYDQIVFDAANSRQPIER